MAVTQSHFRFGIDQGTEATHGWYAPEDVNPASGTIRQNLTFLLRFCLQCDGTLLSNIDAEFQYRKNGGTWTQITTSTSNVKAVTPTCWADAANTTKRLSGTGTFEASSQGCTVDGISGGTAFDIIANGNGETECALQLVGADLAPTDLIEFRLTRDGGTVMDTYAVTPAIQLAVPFERARIVRSPIPFPKATPAFVPSAAVSSAGLTSVSAAMAVGSMAATLALALTGIAGTSALSLGGSAVTIALTGVSATSSPGSVAPTTAPVLSGLAGTSATGTLVSTLPMPLSGVAGTSAVGTLTPTTGAVIDLTGVAGTSSAGTLGSAGTTAFTGAAATGSVGTMTTSFEDALVVSRPRVVRGPFPFPKSVPAFRVGLPNDTALTGVLGSADEGDLLTSVVVGLTGALATSGQGSLQASNPGTGALAGVSATGSPGTLTPVFSFAPSGLQASAALGTPTAINGVIDRPHSITGPFPFLTGGFFQFRQRPRLVNPPSQPITVGLIGVSASSTIASVTTSVDRAMTGQSVTCSAGTLSPTSTVATTGSGATTSPGSLGLGRDLSGVSSTTSTGSVAPVISIELIGVPASSVIGSIAAQADGDIAQSLSGSTTATSQGSLVPDAAFALTGVAATGARGSVVQDISIQLNGVAAATSTGQVASSSTGDVSLTGLIATGSIATIVPEIAVNADAFEAIGETGTVVFEPLVVGLSGLEATGGVGVIGRSEPLIIVFSRDRLLPNIIFSNEDLREG